MNSICMFGSNSLLANHLVSSGFVVHQFGRRSTPTIDFTDMQFKHNLCQIVDQHSYSLYLFCSGLLRSKPILQQTSSEISDSLLVNSIGPVIASELILETNPNARVFLIGSESSRKGSFDMTYALAKGTLRTYVLNKRLLPLQQLLLLSPSTIEDLGMTARRTDIDRLNQYKTSHPKKRFLKSQELADIILNLFNSSIYLSNTEIEVNGGKFANS